MNKIFLGYDPRQAITYNVAQHSIAIRAKEPVSITPLIIEQLPIERRGLTPFTWTRFLVPWLCDYEGWGLFMDGDVLCQCDIGEFFDLADERYAVMAVQGPWKFEWASVMLFNCGHPDNKILTPDYIEAANGLHQLRWTENIGSLPDEYNHLVLYNSPREDAKIIHYTGGVPVYPETKGVEWTKEYQEETRFLISTEPWAALMGQSVHAERVLQAHKERTHAQAESTESPGSGRTAADLIRR